MAGFSAKNARVQINGTTLTANKWMVTAKTDELDISNFETVVGNNVYADYTFGLAECEVQVEAIWDAANNPHTAPPSITAGSTISNLRLYLDKINLAVFWSFPVFQIFTCTTDAEVRGIVKYTFTGKNKGAFTYPGGV